MINFVVCALVITGLLLESLGIVLFFGFLVKLLSHQKEIGWAALCSLAFVLGNSMEKFAVLLLYPTSVVSMIAFALSVFAVLIVFFAFAKVLSLSKQSENEINSDVYKED